MESSRRDLLHDMDEHWAILKNNQNYRHRLGFTPIIGSITPKQGFVFTVRLLFFLFSFLTNVRFGGWKLFP